VRLRSSCWSRAAADRPGEAVGVMHKYRRRARVGRLMRMGRITERRCPESMKPGGVRRASVDRTVEV
jgi:hypothetical protein